MTLPDRVLAAIGPALVDRAGPLLADLVTALTGPLAETDDLAQPTPGGWSNVYDLDKSAHPATLGSATGTTVPTGLSLAQQREWIRLRPTWRRGTPGAVRAAIRFLLTDFQRVDLLERAGSPWRFTVRVYAGQIQPGITEAKLRAYAATQKPVGLVMDLEIVPGASYGHMTVEHGATLADWAAQFPTYETARTHTPEEGSVD